MRLVLDEHLSPAIAEQLRRRGRDVVAVMEVGLQGQPDAALLACAIREGRALVTANYADVRTLHEVCLSRGENHAGIVLVPRRFSLAEPGFGPLIDGLAALLDEHPRDDAMASAETWLGG